MVPECLQNYIGVKCLTVKPKSGNWINDLPGINLKLASNIAEPGYISGLKLIESKILFATEMVIQEIGLYALKYFRMNSVIDSLEAGTFISSYMPPDLAERGVQVTVKNSRLLRGRIKKINISIQEPNFTGYVDVIDGDKVTSYEFLTDSQGLAVIWPDYIADQSKFYITMDGSDKNVRYSNVKDCGSCYTKETKYISVTGWTGSGTTSYTYGISVEVNSECTQENFACIISSRLSLPIMYRAGLEIVKEAAASSRLNSITILNEKQREILKEDFEKEFKRSMHALIEGLPALFNKVDDICVVCNTDRYTQSVP